MPLPRRAARSETFYRPEVSPPQKFNRNLNGSVQPRPLVLRSTRLGWQCESPKRGRRTWAAPCWMDDLLSCLWVGWCSDPRRAIIQTEKQFIDRGRWKAAINFQVLELRRISLTFAGDVADHFDYVAKVYKHELMHFRHRCYKNKKFCTC